MILNFGFKWYDMWVGLFVDKKQPLFTTYYICPLPCILITIKVLKKTKKLACGCHYNRKNSKLELRCPTHQLEQDLKDKKITLKQYEELRNRWCH